MALHGDIVVADELRESIRSRAVLANHVKNLDWDADERALPMG